MTFNIFTNGATADADEVNASLNFLSKQIIINNLNNAKASTDSISGDGFAYTLISDQTDASYVDTGATTCYYDERGVVAICDVLDLFDDASVADNIWSSTVSSATVSEGSGYMRLYASNSTSAKSASVIGNQASAIDFAGQDAEIILSLYYALSEAGGGNGGGTAATCGVQISNGSTHVTLFGKSNPDNTTLSSTSGYAEIRLVYDSSADTIDVYVDGETTPSSTVDVSTVTTNKYLRFYISTNSGTDGASADLRIYGIGYALDGASAGNVVFESAAQTIEQAGSGYTYLEWDLVPASTPTVALSMDSGSNYSSGDANEAWVTSTAGTGLQIKVTAAKPTTINPATTNIPLINSWGVLYS